MTSSMAGSSGPTLGFEDYSMYSDLSEDELLQVAIERSLMDECTPAHSVEFPISPQATPPARPSADVGRSYSFRPPADLSENPSICPPNPPRDIKQELEGSWVSHFTTGYGKKMVAYRRMDGTLIRSQPEQEAVVDPLVKAIWDGDASLVRKIVRAPELNLLQPNKHGWMPIHEAAFYGQEECLKALLGAQPGMVNKRTRKNQSALILAVGRDHTRCVEFLLEEGADPDIASDEKETPLYLACERKNAEMVAILLNFGAAVNKVCIQGGTALHGAMDHTDVEICEMLIKAGAKINVTNKYGDPPFLLAAASGQLNIIRFLLKKGADINGQAGDGATALSEACKFGHEDIVEFLLSQKADANKPGKTGLLPIHIAAQKGNDGKRLLTYDYNNSNVVDSVKIIQMLIPVTSRARVRRCGISPLHHAAEWNRDEILEALIKAGFDVNAELSEDYSRLYEDRRTTALYFATINNNLEAATMLLEAGADPNLDVFSPLLVAVRQGAMEIVTQLVDHGANVNVCIPTVPTTFPATVMFTMKYLPMLKYLMDNGCDAMSCFDCSYGSNIHPPIMATRGRGEELRHRQEEPDHTGVQFCKMISEPSISGWAGPIISVLLDYVGNVKLCARLIDHLDSYSDWEHIKEKSEPPRTLMHLCRVKVRQVIGNKRLRHIDKLPIPGRLINFLKHVNSSEEL